MIEYFEQLTQEEQEDLTDVIRLLYRQTFLLERKFDKRAGQTPVSERDTVSAKSTLIF